MKVKVITAILSVVLLAGAGTAAYFYMKQHEKTPSVTTAEPTTVDPYAGMARSYLTGKYIKAEDAKRRPYAVMINNIQDAIPQYGISKESLRLQQLQSFDEVCIRHRINATDIIDSLHALEGESKIFICFRVRNTFEGVGFCQQASCEVHDFAR